MTKIGTAVFADSADLAAIKIPEGVTALGGGAFTGCADLRWIALPASLTSIGEFTFFDCTALKDVYYAGTQAQWDGIILTEGNEPLRDASIHFETAPPEAEDAPAA